MFAVSEVDKRGLCYYKVADGAALNIINRHPISCYSAGWASVFLLIHQSLFLFDMFAPCKIVFEP